MTEVHEYLRTHGRCRHDAAPNASVADIARSGGYNEWSTDGWTGNEYTNLVKFSPIGLQTGWVTAGDYTETGSGNYSSPEPYN